MELSYTRQSNDFLWYGDSTHPDRDTAVAFASLIWFYYFDLWIAMSLFLGHRRRRGGCCSSTTAPTGGERRCRKRWSQRGRWPRRRLHYYTKVGSRDRGLVTERGSLESLTDVNHVLCEAKSGALSGGSPNDRLNYTPPWRIRLKARVDHANQNAYIYT